MAEKKVMNTYHVVQTRDEEGAATGWAVKLAGGSKNIKTFKTQKEALDYAKKLSDNNDRGVVLHSKKGKARKA